MPSMSDAPTSVRIPAHAEVDPSGAVTWVQLDGTPAAYPDLPKCVIDIVRSLRFPRSSTTSMLNIPFVFAAGDAAR